MTEAVQPSNEPPKLRPTADGTIDMNSLADVVEWFLNFDEQTARMRHPHVNELFHWKQQDDESSGVGTYPFENAEARFAIGVLQAVKENNSEPLLKMWISDVLNALQQAREIDLQRLGQVPQRRHGGRGFAALDLTDHRPADARQFRHGVKAEPACLAGFAQNQQDLFR